MSEDLETEENYKNLLSSLLKFKRTIEEEVRLINRQVAVAREDIEVLKGMIKRQAEEAHKEADYLYEACDRFDEIYEKFPIEKLKALEKVVSLIHDYTHY